MMVAAVACLFWAVVALQADASLPAGSAGSVLYQNVCAQCHGAKGEGKVELRAPSIAGLPAEYVLAQLLHFREGRRGAAPDDPQAFLMSATAKALQPLHLGDVAQAVALLTTVSPPQPSTPADMHVLAQGRQLYQERCMECHRYNGKGEVVFGSAPLIGLQDWYLRAQLRQFIAGKRGTTPGDISGAKMRAAAQYVESEADLEAVVAYMMTLNWLEDPFR
jgi:cytochrome c553